MPCKGSSDPGRALLASLFNGGSGSCAPRGGSLRQYSRLVEHRAVLQRVDVAHRGRLFHPAPAATVRPPSAVAQNERDIPGCAECRTARQSRLSGCNLSETESHLAQVDRALCKGVGSLSGHSVQQLPSVVWIVSDYLIFEPPRTLVHALVTGPPRFQYGQRVCAVQGRKRGNCRGMIRCHATRHAYTDHPIDGGRTRQSGPLRPGRALVPACAASRQAPVSGHTLCGCSRPCRLSARTRASRRSG